MAARLLERSVRLPLCKPHVLSVRRGYRDDSFGFREPAQVQLPDYTGEQLANRTKNAPLLRYVDSMRTHGHRAARIDPLDLMSREEVTALDPARYGLEDPSTVYDVNGIIWTHLVGQEATSQKWTLDDITRHLRSVYVGRIAYEYMHSHSKTERLWFSHMLESQQAGTAVGVDVATKQRFHALLAKSEVFDQFLQAKFPNLKRYGLEGGESMLVALDTLFASASLSGVEHIVLAMPHRGRLNLLTDLLKLDPTALFHKIKGNSEVPVELGATGDVISHITASPSLQYDGAATSIEISLQPNPSHLEAANPVAAGKARAKQYSLLKQLSSSSSSSTCALGDKVMCVQLHGDASFTGQGVVMETLGLSNLPHYTTGGSVHVVVNNNIGYTTPASGARSSMYASDVAKMINAPVLHVNGDYPEDVARAMDIAFKYRQHFRKDIVVDLLVYRRWGHNELDEPAFTQPQMYQQIRSRKSVPLLYEEKLVDEGVLSLEDASRARSAHRTSLDEALLAVDSWRPTASMLEGQWASCVWPASPEAHYVPETGVNIDTLKQVGHASVETPSGFEIHPRLQRHVKRRVKDIEEGKALDWATAEAMAFGSLMLDGVDVRISGQDVGRGTFSHRHAMLVDQATETVTVPLNVNLSTEARLELANSSLSEMAVLGFEVGVSWERPNILPLWEAQFGDFFNGAQVIIDTFISSAETKWLRQSALVMLLPHGLDGAGPEHSSSRIERFLQLTDDRYESHDSTSPANVNMHVAFPTTPAQYFHLLRRQMVRNFRKPLIIAAPKGLLRLPAASSSFAELGPGSMFKPVLDDPEADPSTVSRVVLLSGKLYYDLVKERAIRGLDARVALVRVEELCPFPFTTLEDVLKSYTNANEVLWVQEEPRNQGAFTHVSPRIASILDNLDMPRLKFKGRKEAAVPAPGANKTYQTEQRDVLSAAFDGL